jgi:poly-gamma-glutamate capsule biosynthesis protein CapA/YwtB (metallophosphatase superfamily)
MRIIFIISVFIAAIRFQYFFIDAQLEEKPGNPKLEDSVLTATLCFVGDLMCHSTQFNYAKVDADSFDFTGVFREVKPYLSNADLTIGNLETVIAGKSKSYSGYPYFNAPDDFIYALKDAGFNLLTTANNHALDQGWDGVKRTIDVINENKIHRTGTFTSQKDQDSLRIFQIHSITIAILAYSENTNGVSIPKGKDFVINLIDEELIKRDIDKARNKNVDVVLVYLHYGPEYNREPSYYQKEVIQKIIELGADIIIGGHPHVIEPFDFFKTKNTKLDTGFVAYSMGNFISNQRWRYSDAGVILNIKISKNKFTDSVYISDVNYLPTWVFKGSTEKGREYIILPSQLGEKDSTYTFLNDEDKRLMKEAFNDTKEIVTKFYSKIKLHPLE